MQEAEIRATVSRLETSRVSEEEAAWERLRPLGQRVVAYLAEAYPHMRHWRGRVSLLFHSIPFARESDEAFRLGVRALHDRATLVRYRACCLLAYSLRPEALEHLRPLLGHPDRRTAQDAAAAIEAIELENHHVFLDRDRTGRVFWQVGSEDGFPAHGG